MEASVSRVKLVAGVAPKYTALTVLKSDPVIVTGVPPAVGPLAGLMPVKVGTDNAADCIIAPPAPTVTKVLSP
jgi:hypothetical protein